EGRGGVVVRDGDRQRGPRPLVPGPDAQADPAIYDDPSQVAVFLRGEDPSPPEDYRQSVARHSVRQRPDGRYEWKWDPGLLKGRGGPGGWGTWAGGRQVQCPRLVLRGAARPWRR